MFSQLAQSPHQVTAHTTTQVWASWQCPGKADPFWRRADNTSSIIIQRVRHSATYRLPTLATSAALLGHIHIWVPKTTNLPNG
jgi:hypothetical protein